MKQVVSSDFKLGVIAGGQLGKMLCQAASPWDVKTYILEPVDNCPARSVCFEQIKGDYTKYDDVYAFGKQMDMVTLEIENVNVDALAKLKEEGIPVYPDPEILRTIQDKGLQKQFYSDKNIATSNFSLLESAEEIKTAVGEGSVTIPFVQKLRTSGFDGRGVKVVKSESDLDDLLEGASLIEELVSISKEISVIGCRNEDGDIKTFPVVDMEFNPEANLVEFLFCPATISPEIEAEAKALAEKVLTEFDLVGILAVEMFIAEDGRLMVNEVAPRPHNSGHHTIEACYTSQYEQHLRAIFNFPLGNTDVREPAVMVNILGAEGHIGPVKYDGLDKVMGVDGVNIHIYGKEETRPFRKMGHATILASDLGKAKEKAKFVQDNLNVIT